MRPRNTGERALIRAIRRRLSAGPPPPLGPGDDSALIPTRGSKLVALTTDMLLDGVHFDTSAMTARQIGRKALAVGLSDVAAMAMRPAAAVVAVALPERAPMSFAKALVDGMARLAKAFEVCICGGDVTSWRNPAAVCVTVLGHPGRHKPVLRSGARVGHDVYVTGPLGGSILRKHWSFTPRVREGLILGRALGVSAMIDVSDGLSTDLCHIIEASSVGACIDESSIPVSRAARRLSKDTQRPAIEHALHDGEDFELLFTAPKTRRKRLLAGAGLPTPPVRIGVIEKEKGLRIRDRKGNVRKLEPLGYEHLKGTT